MIAFSRFSNLMAAIAVSMGAGMSRVEALSAHGGYESRGKGKSTPSKQYTRTVTTFKVPHGGGAREVARRQRQIAKGMLQVSPT